MSDFVHAIINDVCLHVLTSLTGNHNFKKHTLNPVMHYRLSQPSYALMGVAFFGLTNTLYNAINHHEV